MNIQQSENKRKEGQLIKLIEVALKTDGAWKLFELLTDTMQKSEVSDLEKSVKEWLLLENNAFVIPEVDLIQEHELQIFCKEKGIKLQNYFTC